MVYLQVKLIHDTMNEMQKTQRLHQILKIKSETEDSLFYIDPKYLNEILADLAELIVMDIAHDKPYNILEFFSYITYINDLTCQQKLYMAFKLGQQFGIHPEKLEEMVMIPYLDRAEKLDKVH